MTKEHIIAEIRRTAKENAGVPLGSQRFRSETGIGRHDWYGKFWARWGDAVREAGYEPNRISEAYDEGFLLEKLISVTRSLGRVPVEADLLLTARSDSTFPSKDVFLRLGATKRQRAQRIVAYCEANVGNDDVAALWKSVAVEVLRPDATETNGSPPAVGYVYLLKHGTRREYKIGFTYNRLRREGEVRIELPEALEPMHYIETDDPAGVENYWHRRFADKRLKNEWFALAPEEVRAFKRWRRIH